MLFAASWSLSSRLHGAFQSYALSNIVIRRVHTRSGIKWGALVGAFGVVVYGAVMVGAVALLHDFVEPALRDTGEDRPLQALARLKFQKKIGPGARLTIRLHASKEDTVRFEVFDAGELAASGQLELEPTTSDEEERIKADRR